MNSKKINIIILHGWGSAPKKWKGVTNTLYELKRKNKKIDFSIHVPILPGFDKQNPSSEPLTIDDYMLWLDDFIKKNCPDKPILVGHSNGGKIACCYASLHTNKISKLILIASSGIPPKNSIKRITFEYSAKIGKNIIGFLGSKKLSTIARKILYKLAREKDYYNANPAMKKTMQNMLKINILPLLKDIKNPTFILWGREDKVTPLWMAHVINQHIKNSRLKIVEGGHSLNITNYVRVSDYIYNCLTDD